MMNYKLFGHTGLRVSELALGTMTFGEDWGWGASKDEARKLYDAYRERGGNFIDTANIYTEGSSERFVGEFVKDHRDEVVVATKFSNASAGTDPNAAGNHRKSLTQSIDASLSRLGTDYVDILWLHAWDSLTPVEEVMRGFEDVLSSGKALYIGISDAPAWVVAKSNTLAELRGWPRYAGLQIEYSLLERTVERELIPVANDQQMSVVAWSPLKNGLLTGKYLPGASAGSGEGRLSTEMMKEFAEVGEGRLETVREVVAVAKEVGRSPAQVALAWLRSRSARVIPIVGARKLHQLEDNMESLTLELDAHHLERLESASAIELGFPHDFLASELPRTLIHGGMRDRIQA